MSQESGIGSNPFNNQTSEQFPPERSIFRSEALQHYLRAQDKVVLPRLVSPRFFLYLWLFASLLLAAGFAVAFWPLIGPWVAGLI